MGQTQTFPTIVNWLKNELAFSGVLRAPLARWCAQYTLQHEQPDDCDKPEFRLYLVLARRLLR